MFNPPLAPASPANAGKEQNTSILQKKNILKNISITLTIYQIERN